MSVGSLWDGTLVLFSNPAPGGPGVRAWGSVEVSGGDGGACGVDAQKAQALDG
jgi:hypothetical protein